MRILLVEDDETIAAALCTGLTRYGYSVSWVDTGQAALAEPEPDLVLLDLGLPDMDGLDVCRALRRRTDVPIIVITARADETDTVAGLEVGADDYVSKPFGVREIVARVRAVLRRYRRDGEPDPTPVAGGAGTHPAATPTGFPVVPGGGTPAEQRLGALTVNRRARRVHIGDTEVQLAPKEFDLLAFLAEEPGAAFSREQILEAVWDMHWHGPTRTLDVHVAALRRKLEGAVLIETVRGVGFRLEAVT